MKTHNAKLDANTLSVFDSHDLPKNTLATGRSSNFSERDRSATQKKMGRSTFSQYYLDDHTKDMVSIASIDTKGTRKEPVT